MEKYNKEQQRALAIRAAAGDREALGELWEAVELLMYRLCWRLYTGQKELADRAGVEFDDYKQAAYFGFLGAVKAFEPSSGYEFITFLKLPLKNAIAELLGIRSSKRDGLLFCDSLNVALSEDDPDSGEKIDFIPDDTAATAFDSVIDSVYHEELYQCLENCIKRLPERQQHVINRIYYDGATLQTVGGELSVCIEQARQIRNQALRQLRKNKRLQAFRDEIIATAYKGTGSGSFRFSGRSSVERVVERLDQMERNAN